MVAVGGRFGRIRILGCIRRSICIAAGAEMEHIPVGIVADGHHRVHRSVAALRAGLVAVMS